MLSLKKITKTRLWTVMKMLVRPYSLVEAREAENKTLHAVVQGKRKSLTEWASRGPIWFGRALNININN